MAATPTASQEPTTKGPIGRIVAGSVLGGLAAAVALVAGPLAGAREHVITGSVLLAFAAAWTAMALLSERWTNQPQRWALAPAGLMGIAGVSLLVVAPTGNELGWVWPPMLATLVVWMAVRSRRALRSRTHVWLLYPVFGVLLLGAVGGAYETYREAADQDRFAMPGRLVDVGGHKLHIDCTGSGSPTVVLEPGLGEPSTAMAWIAPDIAATTRVCVYDRAGRGWSESAGRALDGFETAADLHTLLARAGEKGPFVLAGHSAGGIYVLDFAARYPEQVAGVVLLDSMSPHQYAEIDSWPAFYETFRRVSAVLPSLSRFGVGRVMYQTAYGDLPALARDEQRAFWATPRHNRSLRDEFSRLRTAMAQAQSLTSLTDRPLVVLTAEKDALGGWMAAQDELAALSTNSVHRSLPYADHEMLTERQVIAEQSSHAIRDVVDAVRTGTPLDAPVRPTATRDELVAVNGGSLHVHCAGAGPTTVVLISGFNVGPGSWATVEPALAPTTRVCSYDRFGAGASSAPPLAPQTFATQAADLHALLEEVGEPGPYVVVGHSFGGAEAVTLASMYPNEILGLLLLDASPTSWNTTVCSVPDDGSDAARSFALACAEQADPANNAERLDGPRALAEVAGIETLGPIPMTVMTAAIHQYDGLDATEAARLNGVWNDGQTHWVSLASSVRLVSVENTSHFIQLDHPDLVIEEIEALLGGAHEIAG